jgi:hypothetical protein
MNSYQRGVADCIQLLREQHMIHKGIHNYYLYVAILLTQHLLQPSIDKELHNETMPQLRSR